MGKNSVIAVLVVSLIFVFLLSSLSNILGGYQISSHQDENPPQPSPEDNEEEPSVALFKVTPIFPQLYWRIWSADVYTGSVWVRSTNETILDALPMLPAVNATKVFTVEINTTQSEIFLPLPSSQSTFENASLSLGETLKLYLDVLGDTYKLKRYGYALERQVLLTYNVSWNNVRVEDNLISPSDIPKEILDKYLQLPQLPLTVRKLAEELEDPSYSILDQILADVQYLRTDFVYDRNIPPSGIYGEIGQGSDVSFYLQIRRGVCIDAATALAVILRFQGIPARISVGFKPGAVEGSKLAYYTEGAHALTEVFLPPYGWVQFDATPPTEDTPFVSVAPFKKQALPGSQLFFQVSIMNRLNSTENFRLLVEDEQRWAAEAAPAKLTVHGGQTADALIEVVVPDSASFGERDMLSLTVYLPNQNSFSVLVIVQVANVTSASTTTALGTVDEAIVRGEKFWLNGTVLDTNDAGVENMTVFAFITKVGKAAGVIAGKGVSKQGKVQIYGFVPSSLEVGDYRIMLISLGTSGYAASSGESTAKVTARTSIELGSEKELLIGYGAVHGKVSWDNGTGLANAVVTVKMSPSTNPSEVRGQDNLTSTDGTFRIETPFEAEGEYEVQATFLGNQYILGSRAAGILNLRRGQPEILITAGKVAVRGENWTISGQVQSDQIGIWGEPLTIELDQQPLTKIETRENGAFHYSFIMSSEEELGAHVIVVSLVRSEEIAIHDVDVKSKTNLATRISNVAGGMFLLFSANLTDDHNMPIQGAVVTIENYGISLKTDENGSFNVILDNVQLWPENSTVTASFEGSQFYLPAATVKVSMPELWTSLLFLLPLAVPGLLVLAVVCVKYVSSQRQLFQQARPMRKTDEKQIIKAKPREMQKTQPLRIVLPDVASEFPPVWGINEKLRIEIALDESLIDKIQTSEVEISIDGEKGVPLVFSDQGRAEYSCLLTQKGEHGVRAHVSETSSHRALDAELTLRIVDYEEEILRLYKEFLGQLASQDVDIREEMTAREIESLALSEANLDSYSLRKVTTCFENAEYSSNSMGRADYEILYLSLKELNINVE